MRKGGQKTEKFEKNFSREAIRAAEAYEIGRLLKENPINGGMTSNAGRLDTEIRCLIWLRR